MPEDRQLRKLEDGPVLREEEVRLQEAIAVKAPSLLGGRGARVGVANNSALDYLTRRVDGVKVWGMRAVLPS